MVDTFTPNKSLDKPPNNADPGTWDVPVNNNADAIDSAFGGLTTLNANGASGVVGLSLAQYTPPNIVITGAPTGPVTYQLPAGVGGFYFIANLCNATNPANNVVSFGSASVAGTVPVPGGISAVIVIDPFNGARLADTIEAQAVGPTGAVQYVAASGLAGGDVGLTYNSTTQALAVGGPLNIGGNLSLATGKFVNSRLILNGGANTRTVFIPYAASIAVNCALSNVFSTTLTGNIGAVAITGMDDGQTINWRLIQDNVAGGRTITWPSNFRWPGGTAPSLSTPLNAVDLLVATYFAANASWLASLLKGFS